MVDERRNGSAGRTGMNRDIVGMSVKDLEGVKEGSGMQEFMGFKEEVACMRGCEGIIWKWV